MNATFNLVETGGQFGRRRRLGTMTIHQHENGMFYVTDDWKGDRVLSVGHATVEDAEKANRWSDDKRLCNV